MRYYVVDAFATKIFEGNPAGVLILEAALPDALMQSIAIENNLSETAFAVREGENYRLCWFTPGGEIDLCGHATLATAYILFKFYHPRRESVCFHTLSGDLTVRREGTLFAMDFPSIPVRPHPPYAALARALGALPTQVYMAARDPLCVLESARQVAELTPDFRLLREIPEGLGVFVTAKGEPGSGQDFVSRAFWPKLSVDEDPVCGCMHCALVPFWAERLGKKDLVARQVSRRGGTLYCTDRGERVCLRGHAALYAQGEIRL